MTELVANDGPLLELQKTFRPAKRRKIYRKTANNKDDSPESTPQPTVARLTLDELVISQGLLPGQISASETAEVPVAEILRQRRYVQRRKGGIEFTNNGYGQKSSLNGLQNSKALQGRGESTADLEATVNRFAPQTGQVVNADKHMMAYIDSELAKRRQGQIASTQTANGKVVDDLEENPITDYSVHRQPAALGKLHEIDLGPDAKARNIAATEAAKRKLEGRQEEVEQVSGKVRLNRNGKPWRPRRRRNSQDVKRDQLVEQVLRESRLEIYDEPDEDPDDGDQAADDRIAEQFRREFLDAVSSRRKKTVPAASAKAMKGADEKPKGPKLGGSRSARAAMREQQEKALKK